MSKKNYLFKSDRLQFRELTIDDAVFAYELNLDPDVNKYTGDEPFDSIEEALNFMQSYSDYKKHDMGRWGVELKETGKLIGWAGLKFSEETQEIDLGYRFFKSKWGKGYATEAAQACLDYGFKKLKVKRVVAYTMERNKASIRVLEKIGMSFLKHGDECGDKTLTYEITRK